MNKFIGIDKREGYHAPSTQSQIIEHFTLVSNQDVQMPRPWSRFQILEYWLFMRSATRATAHVQQTDKIPTKVHSCGAVHTPFTNIGRMKLVHKTSTWERKILKSKCLRHGSFSQYSLAWCHDLWLRAARAAGRDRQRIFWFLGLMILSSVAAWKSPARTETAYLVGMNQSDPWPTLGGGYCKTETKSKASF